MGASSFEDLAAEGLAMALHECLKRADLERLCSKLGIEFPGHRLAAVDGVELAFALTDAVLNRKPGHELVGAEIGRVLAPALERVASLEPAEIRRRLGDLARELRPGVLFVSLSLDPRRAVSKLATRVPDAVDAPREEAPPADVPPAVRTWVCSIARRADALEARVEELKRDVAARDEKLAAAHGRTERLERELAEARGESQRLAEAARALRTDDRERRKLEHELAGARRDAEGLRPAAAERDALKGDVERLRAELAEARSAVEAARAKRPEEPRPRPSAPPRPPDATRAALVVDGQSLYFEARERGGRADFARFRDAAPSGVPVARAVIYIAEVPTVDASHFRKRLAAAGYDVRAVPVPSRDGGRRVPDEHTVRLLAQEIRDAAARYRTVLVATHCTALAAAMAEARAAGASVRLLAFADTVAAVLRESAEEVVDVGAAFLIAR